MNVHNDLDVALPPGNYRDDSVLAATVNDALTLNDTVPVGVETTVKNGNLTLTGTVRNTPPRRSRQRTGPTCYRRIARPVHRRMVRRR